MSHPLFPRHMSKKKLSVYVNLHLVLMLAVSIVIWFPVFFVLYGGVQAVVLLYWLNRKASAPAVEGRRRWVDVLLLMEAGYSVALAYVGAHLFCESYGICDLSPGWLKGTMFTNPEFCYFMPGVGLSAFYLLVAVIWGIVSVLKTK